MKKWVLLTKAIVFVVFFGVPNGLIAQANKVLYDEISRMDSVLFNAFNSQDTVTMKTLFTDELEWYQDNGKFQGLLAMTIKNITTPFSPVAPYPPLV